MSHRIRLGWWVVAALAVASLPLAGAEPDRRLPDAARKQDRVAIRALVTERADVNGRQPDGATALHWATHWADLETVTVLLAAGADANAANDFGVTPLSMACEVANVAIVDALLRAGAKPTPALPDSGTAVVDGVAHRQRRHRTRAARPRRRRAGGRIVTWSDRVDVVGLRRPRRRDARALGCERQRVGEVQGRFHPADVCRPWLQRGCGRHARQGGRQPERHRH